jgi:small-conductance mechanosensitive channel
MEALGGHVLRRNRVGVEDAYFEKQIAADREELAALEAELRKASEDRKARLEARIEDTRHKLRDRQEQLEARIESTKREGEAKIKSLQQQLTTAREELKQRVEKRLAAVRADYRERSAKLHQAWELTKAALAEAACRRIDVAAGGRRHTSPACPSVRQWIQRSRGERSTVCFTEASAVSSDVRILSTAIFRTADPLKPVKPSCSALFSVRR